MSEEEAPPRVVSVRRYEVGAPANATTDLVEPDGTVATTKEEEWVTKKKTELTTRRQIETRVKRQVVLEDGKVVDDSGPIVTTSTTEDTEKEEHHHTEHRTSGDDPPEGEQWAITEGPDGLVREVREHTVKSREEREERVETEDVKHLGDLTDDAYLAAVCSGQDVRLALTDGVDGARGDQLVQAAGAGDGPREVHRSVRAVRVTDTSDVLKQSARQADGRLVTETRETREREEVREDEAPDPEQGEHGEQGEERETRHESSQRHARLKDEHVVEYLADGVKIGEEMRYVSEEAEGSREGGAEPGDLEWDSLSTRVRRMRRAPPAADRKDALTKRPLDFDQEEETRKAETCKWLEHHFGSESRSSKGSLDDDEAAAPAPATNTSFINVTMKSRPLATRSPAGQPPAVRGYVATVNSSARVFVSSPEPEELPHAPAASVPPPLSPPSSNGASAGGFFRGVSDWSERRKTTTQPTVVVSTVHGPSQRVQVLPNGPHHTFSPLNGERRGSPYNGVPERASPQYNGTSSVDRVSSPYGGSTDRVTSPFEQRDRARSPSPAHAQLHAHATAHAQQQQQRLLVNGHSPALRVASYGSAATERDRDLSVRESPTPPRTREDSYPRRRYPSEEEDGPSDGYRGQYRGWERQRRRQREPDADAEAPGSDPRRHPEPPPDYSPPTPSPSPPPEDRPTAASKKVFQRTRFSADIPPPPQPQPPPQHHKRTIGESFRKLVGKFRTSSSERKKQQQRKGSKQRAGSRSPSPSPFNSTGSGSIPGGKARGACAVAADGWEGQVEGEGRPSAPPRASRAAQSRSSGGSGNMMQQQRRFYLGEDPFGGSIYGREREYDGVVPARRKHRQLNGHRRHDEDDDPARYHNGVNGSALGRFSKSTSRLVTSSSSTTPPPSATVDYTRSAQTLPRKLYDDHGSGSGSGVGGRIKRSLYAQQKTAAAAANGNANGSTINVSIINHVTPPGPAKPARTYRSSLARSQSFNVHALSSTPASAPVSAAPAATLNGGLGLYKSNPQLHRLDESPPPLKSPGILASISRSQRDLTKATDAEPDNDRLHRTSNFTDSKFSRSTSNLVTNGGLSPRESKRRVFLQELRERAPELYRTLHASDDLSSDLSTDPAPPTRPARATHRTTSNAYRNGNTTRAATTNLDYSSSFRSSSTNDSPSYRSTDKRTPLVNGSGTTTTVERRRGSGSDDYSETVRITSTVDDPVRPTVTNTVQSFTKKTVPLRGGLSTETIESSETTTVTKSRYTPSPRLLDGPSSPHNGGIVIEVRPRK